MRCMARRDISNSRRHLLTYIPVEAAVQENTITFSQREAFVQQIHEYFDIIKGVRFNSYDTFIENPSTGGPGEASLSLASRFDLLGSSGVLQGFDYIEYPPFEDAPQEGDYNLLASIGKAIAAVAIVAVLAFVIGATGGLALALVGGAAVFAGCVVYSDYQNGNVSDFGTYLAAAISGAIVGAISYMFFAQAALAIKTIAGGTQFIGLVGAQLGIPFLMTNAKLLATIAGYGLAGFFGLQGVNYFSSAVSGSENALVGIFFEEGTPEYYQALVVYNEVALLGNMLGMGYLQEAVRHMPPITVPVTSPKSKKVNPNEIRFSQSSVNGADEITESMEQDGWVGNPIDVVEMSDGELTTIDNTRVVSAREAGINAEVTIHNYNDPLPEEYIDRFSTKNGAPSTWGEAIEFRVQNQNSDFRNNNPNGTYELPKVNN